MMKKIVHLCLSNFYVDNYSYQENVLTKFHIKQGYDVTVIAKLFTYDKNGRGVFLPGPSVYKEETGCKVIRLAFKKPTKWNKRFRHFVGFRETLFSEAPDIIFMHGASFGDTPIVKEYMKEHPNTKLFADSHTDYVNSATNFLSKHILHRIVWRHYIKVVEPYMSKYYGVTPQRCRFLKEIYGVNPDLVEFLPLGVDDDLIPSNRHIVRKEIRNKLGLTDNDILIVTGGKIDERKNTHILIDALERLDDKRIHLVICGVLIPPMLYLKERIDANKNIHYLGWCNAEQVMNNMIASDMACFPGTHSTLWEQAVGVGLPAIFKRWNEMEHVNVNENCVFVKGEDVEELKSSILQMLDDKQYHKIKSLAEEASKSFLYSEIAKKAIIQ